MKFICTQSNLANGVSIVEKVVGKNFTLPILQNILIECKKNSAGVQLTATDLEVGITVTIPGKIEEEGTSTVPARLFANTVRNLPQEKVKVSEKKKEVTLTCRNYTSTLKGESANDFPLLPRLVTEKPIRTKSTELIHGISSVIHSVSYLDMKPEIAGIYTQFSDGEICFTATDSFRLAEKKVSSLTNKGMCKIIIPRKTGELLMRIFQNFDQVLTWYMSANQLSVTNTTENPDELAVRLVSRVIDGDYPDYEKIIPQSFTTRVEVSREELIQHIKTASLFSSKVNDITLRITPTQQVEVTAEGNDAGHHRSTVSCSGEGKTHTLSFNYLYLLDGLSTFPSATVTLNVNEGTMPVLISAASLPDFRYIIMPIKI